MKKLVWVEWVDSSRADGWQDTSAAERGIHWNLRCTSVGWVASESKTALSLAPHRAHHDGERVSQVSGLLVIPRCAIRRIRRLKEPA